MRSDETIIERGRGPEIKGTRITVFDVLDYLLAGWPTARIAAWLGVSSDQVQGAVDYLQERRLDVLRDYVRILERSAHGNAPELQARIDAGHARFQDLVKQVQEARAGGATDVSDLVRRHRGAATTGGGDGANHGRQ